jgi:predicted metal-dependent TIM-barrel fold hydrolase
MDYIDLHAHMLTRAADDYSRLALTGCVAVSEPAYWHPEDRHTLAAFGGYYNRLLDVEPRRAARYGIRHYAWLCMSPRQAEDRQLSLAVLSRLPRLLERPTVVGIGETGLFRGTRNEIETFRDHIELALEHDLLLLVRTPHLEDKYRGTRLVLDTLAADGRINPHRVLIDHAEEHTVGMILDQGYWAGVTLYPRATATPARAIDILERFGPDRICVASGCDEGPSSVTAVAEFILAMRRRGHPDPLIRRIVFDHPATFLGQSPNFHLDPHAAEHAPARAERRVAPGEAAEPVAAGGP